MAIHLTQEKIKSYFGEDAECSISYKNVKKRVEGKVKHINWKNCVALTVKFDKPHIHVHPTEGIVARDGVRIVVKK